MGFEDLEVKRWTSDGESVQPSPSRYICGEQMVDGWMQMRRKKNLEKLVEGLVDENERDEDGEDFLSEARDEPDQEAAFDRHDDHHNHDEPHAHPDAAYDVLNALGLAELVWMRRDETR